MFDRTAGSHSRDLPGVRSREAPSRGNAIQEHTHRFRRVWGPTISTALAQGNNNVGLSPKTQASREGDRGLPIPSALAEPANYEGLQRG
jgi:hypothetical protein